MISAWTYDVPGQPVAVSHTGSEGELRSAWGNTFDGEGNLVRSERVGSDGDRLDRVFEYDHLGRLTSAGRAQDTMSFGWDGASNRVSARRNQSVTSAVYDAADQVTAFGLVTYRHDAIGNLIERTGEGQPRLACTYDGLGRLTGLRVSDDVIAYEHDGLGRRVSRTDGAGRTRRIFDGVSVVAELSPTGDVALETTAGLLVLHRQDPAGEYYVHADGNSNAAVITNHGGAVLAQYEYTAFGTQVPLSSDPEPPVRPGFCGVLGVRDHDRRNLPRLDH